MARLYVSRRDYRDAKSDASADAKRGRDDTRRMARARKVALIAWGDL